MEPARKAHVARRPDDALVITTAAILERLANHRPEWPRLEARLDHGLRNETAAIPVVAADQRPDDGKSRSAATRSISASTASLAGASWWR